MLNDIKLSHYFVLASLLTVTAILYNAILTTPAGLYG